MLTYYMRILFACDSEYSLVYSLAFLAALERSTAGHGSASAHVAPQLPLCAVPPTRALRIYRRCLRHQQQPKAISSPSRRRKTRGRRRKGKQRTAGAAHIRHLPRLTAIGRCFRTVLAPELKNKRFPAASAAPFTGDRHPMQPDSCAPPDSVTRLYRLRLPLSSIHERNQVSTVESLFSWFAIVFTDLRLRIGSRKEKALAGCQTGGNQSAY